MNKFKSGVTGKHRSCYFYHIKSSRRVQHVTYTYQCLSAVAKPPPRRKQRFTSWCGWEKNNEGQEVFLLQYFLNVQLLPNNLSNSLDGSLRARTMWWCVKSTNAPQRINKWKCSPRGVQSDPGFYLRCNSWGSHSACSWLNWSWMVTIKQGTLSKPGLSYLDGYCQ